MSPPRRRVAIVGLRSDAPGHVGRLRDRFIARYGAPRVAVYDEISVVALGANDQAPPFSALVVLMGQAWPSADESNGAALNQLVAGAVADGIPTLPVLVAGRHLPSSADLPPILGALNALNIVEVSDERWPDDLRRRVYRFLDGRLGDRPRRLVRKPVAVLVATGLVVAGGAAAWVESQPTPQAPIVMKPPAGAPLGFQVLNTACYHVFLPRQSKPQNGSYGNGCSYLGSIDDAGVVSLDVSTFTGLDNSVKSMTAYDAKLAREGGFDVVRQTPLTVGGFPAEELFEKQTPKFGGPLFEWVIVVRTPRPFNTEGGVTDGFAFQLDGVTSVKDGATVALIGRSIGFNSADPS